MTSVEKPSVLILGAGVNGCAVARELVLNGVEVCLVDRADLATGATAKSTRLVHGGLRYLEHAEFDLVRESIEERGRLMRLAPQFVQPLRLFIPAARRGGGWWDALRRFFGRPGAKHQSHSPRGLWLIRLGLWLYDVYARDRALPRHRTHRVGEPGAPKVDAAQYRWLASYSDAQMLYPERFVVALVEDARRAAAAGEIDLRVFTHHQVRLKGPRAEVYRNDETSEPVLQFRPWVIVNATGAWGDFTLQQLGVPSERLFGGTKGSHILTRNERLKEALGEHGVYAEAPDGRLVFVLPAGESVLVGTTDVPFSETPDRAVATREELDYLLAMAGAVFPGVGLLDGDIEMHYSGVRPLPYSDEAEPGAITRRHHIVETNFHGTPVFTLVGGKLTTCRAFGEATADRVLERLGISRTADTGERVVPGGEGYPPDDESLENEWNRLARQYGVGVDAVEAIWSLVGTRAEEILAPLSSRCDERLEGTSLPVEFARWVTRNEWVATLEDLVERRLMLLYHPRLSRKCLEQLARLLVETGWLAFNEVEPCVNATVEQLRRYYGKTVIE